MFAPTETGAALLFIPVECAVPPPRTPPEMAGPARLSLGQTRTGWAHLVPQLHAFGRACEAIVQGTIAFELTDDAYIGRACFRLTGDVRRLDKSVFAQWVAASPWPCTFAPAHDG